MKRYLYPLLLCLVSGIASGQTLRYDTIRYARDYYAKRVNEFSNEPIKKGNVIFLGNSIVEYGDWKKLLADSAVVNRGIAADNTYGVLDRLDNVTAHQPRKLFIEIGINDISQNIPIDTIVKNILKIAARVQSECPKAEIYIHSILPTNDNVRNEYPDAYNKGPQTDLVNKRLKSYSKERNFQYIDLNKVLRDRNGKLDVKYAASDGLHLNEHGYQKWVEVLRQSGYLK